MRESEIKGACSGEALARLETYLISRGFALREDRQQEDTYYDHPCRSFAETDEALRLRRVYGSGADSVLFTYKGPNLARRGQLREELETAVDDAAVMAAALQRLGFLPVAAVRKRRRILAQGDVTVCLDEVEGLGCFFEIEILGSQDSSDAAARLAAMAEELRFLPYREEPRTYLELLQAKNR